VYWSPEFLFHLGSRWGFGIEDFLFVAFLGMLTYAAYPIVFQKKLQTMASKTRRVIRFLPLVLGGLALAIILSSSLIPIIHGTWCVMDLFVLATWIIRKDLIGPSCASGVIMAIGYELICLAWQIFYPGIFTSTWNQEALCGFFLWSIPIEELLYAGVAGMSGVLLYPLLTNQKFISRAAVAEAHKSTYCKGLAKTTDTLFEQRETK
ncbi:MAG: lycopene cyclase domain-containing protein, partial [Lentisphaeria bacterium]